jgi:TP901 family phage tail tape measure protein
MAGKKFSIEAIFSAVDRLSAPMAKIRGKLGQLGKAGNKALGGMNRAVDSGLGALGRASSALGIAGVASIAGLGLELRNVMTSGAEFEKVLVRTGTAFETPIRIGTEGFAKLSAAARNVGKTTEFSALQGAEALNALATAGYTVEQSIAALPKVIDFASAGGLELGQASDIASDSLGAFGLRSADAATNAANMARVMDSLSRAAADSTTNTAELFEGIRMGGAFAATSGASIEQFTALMGVLANKGIKGSEAGTAIRNSFLHLTKPTTEAKDTMARLGIKIAKTESGAIDMTATIGRFTKATAKLTKTQKASAIAAVFGAYTVGPFLSLMDAGEGTIKQFTKNLEGAAGVTQRMAEQMREAKAAKIARFWNIIEDVRLTVFDAIAPTVLGIAESIGKWVTANQELIGTKAGEWAAELRDALPEIWKWTVRAGKAFAVFAGVAVAVKTVNLAILAYEAATKLATGVTWLWKGAVVAARFATDATTLATIRSTIASVANRVAQMASTAATAIGAAALWAYNAPLHLVTLATIRSTVATGALKVAQLAAAAAQWVVRAAVIAATAIQTAYAVVVGTSSGALGAFRIAALASVPAIAAQTLALAPLVITLGAVAAAATALALVWQQLSGLGKDLEGSGGITGTIAKMWNAGGEGTWDPFKAHDAAMNDKARADAFDRDARQMVTPGERAASEAAEGASAIARVDGTVTVRSEPGTKASVKTKPNTIPLKLEQSGAL